MGFPLMPTPAGVSHPAFREARLNLRHRLDFRVGGAVGSSGFRRFSDAEAWFPQALVVPV